MLAGRRWGWRLAAPGLVALVLTGGCATSSPSLPPGHARVARVVDGDTVVVDLDGHERTVRLLGIDTPETHHPDRPVECHGPEAAARLGELLPPGTEVRLERDVEPLDRYGRLYAGRAHLPATERRRLGRLVRRGRYEAPSRTRPRAVELRERPGRSDASAPTGGQGLAQRLF